MYLRCNNYIRAGCLIYRITSGYKDPRFCVVEDRERNKHPFRNEKIK